MTEFNRYQQEITDWKAAMMPHSENTPRKEFRRSLEEVQELDSAIKVNDPEQIGAEAVDVIIRMIGIATIVGCNIDELLDKKITQTTQHKYPPSMIKANMDLGDSWQQSMKRQKVIWQKRTSMQKGIDNNL